MSLISYPRIKMASPGDVSAQTELTLGPVPATIAAVPAMFGNNAASNASGGSSIIKSLLSILAGTGAGMGAGMLTAPFADTPHGQVALMAALAGGGGLGSYFTRRALDRFGVEDRA